MPEIRRTFSSARASLSFLRRGRRREKVARSCCCDVNIENHLMGGCLSEANDDPSNPVGRFRFSFSRVRAPFHSSEKFPIIKAITSVRNSEVECQESKNQSLALPLSAGFHFHRFDDDDDDGDGGDIENDRAKINRGTRDDSRRWY